MTCNEKWVFLFKVFFSDCTKFRIKKNDCLYLLQSISSKKNFLNLDVLVFILYALIKIISATSLEVIIYLFLIDI